MNKTPRIALLLTAVLSATQVFATTIDTGPGPDYGGGSTLAAVNSQSPYHQSLAGRFMLQNTETITSVSGWLNWNYPGQVSFSITSDASGVPGSFIHSTTIDVPVTPINHPDWRGASQLGWDVDAGTYWLVISVPEGESASGSMPQGPVTSPLQAYAADWTYSNGFAPIGGAEYGMRIIASPVPEPTQGALLAAGILALLFLKRSVPRSNT
jgi:hypothetical protein